MKSAETEKLSPTMLSALDYAKAHGNKIHRFPGGFWAANGWGGANSDPFWYGASTIEALVKRGKMEYTVWQNRSGGGKFPIEATVTT